MNAAVDQLSEASGGPASLRQQIQRGWALRHGALADRVPVLPTQEPTSDPGSSPRRQFRQQLFEQVLRDAERRDSSRGQAPLATRQRVRRALDRVMAANTSLALSDHDLATLETQLIAEIDGLGPLDRLLANPTVSDVLVNGPYEVWVERFGRLERTKVQFDSEAHLLRLLGRVIAAQGRRLDEASPFVDVRLSDGSRLNAVIAPLCNRGAVVSIRRTRAVPYRLEQLYAYCTLDPAMGELLGAAVRDGRNIVIAGSTGSGKTTLLNVFSRFIPAAERVVTIEETAELRLDHPHVISLEARPPNIEGRGEVTLRDLVRNALRMRANRLIVGEVRGPEVFDMLQAMNTGHCGSLTTVHANSPEDTLRRLENLVHLSGFELPSRVIRELLGAAFDLIVYAKRFADGSRRVTRIEEVQFDSESGLTTRTLFRYQPGSGRFVAEGTAAEATAARTTVARVASPTLPGEHR